MNTASLPYDAGRLRVLADELIVNIAELARAGWTPATSSNRRPTHGPCEMPTRCRRPTTR